MSKTPLLALTLLCAHTALAAFCTKGWIPSKPSKECAPYALSAEANSPLACNVPVASTASGNCACNDGETIPTHGCVHDTYVCEERCRLKVEQKHISELGLDFMRSVSAVFATVVMPNTAKSLAHTRGLVDGGAPKFNRILVVLQLVQPMEAYDAETKAELGAWQGQFGSRCALSPSDNGPSPTNSWQWGAVRNMYLNFVRTKYGDHNFLVVFDSHVEGLTWEQRGLSHSFGLKMFSDLNAIGPSRRREYHHYLNRLRSNWDMMCSNAMSTKNNGRYADSANYRDYYFTDLNYQDHDNVVHDPLDEPEMVESCYGGLAMYKLSRVVTCAYGGTERESEHLALHRCLRNANVVLWFNPYQVVSVP